MQTAQPKIDALVFCGQPGRAGVVDDIYAPEAEAARRAGFGVELIDHDAAARGDVDRALRRVDSDGRGRRFLYRGWMMIVPAFRALVTGLEARNWVGVTSARDYEACHHLVGWVADIAEFTPRSERIPHTPPFDGREVAALLRKFAGPVIVKDYVKSEKHAWNDACFIPDTREEQRALAVINRFVELRGGDFEGGLVLREFLNLRSIGADPRSGMPLSRELRSFWRGSECVAISDYWKKDDPDAIPDVALQVARRVNRPFYTIDLAMTSDGCWVVMEVGDGQVSALPDSLAPDVFYAALRSG